MHFLKGRLGYITSRFLNLGTSDMLDQIILCGGGRPVHCRKFSSISGLYTLHASSTPPVWQPKMSPDVATCPLGPIAPHIDNHCISQCQRNMTGNLQMKYVNDLQMLDRGGFWKLRGSVSGIKTSCPFSSSDDHPIMVMTSNHSYRVMTSSHRIWKINLSYFFTWLLKCHFF